MAAITFNTTLYQSQEAGEGLLLSLPKEASAQLPSRGIAMVEGVFNTTPFRTVLEPDGKGSHWFKVNEDLRKTTGVKVGDAVELTIQSTNEWSEPKLPTDMQEVLKADPEAQAIWNDITPMARWDWVRWAGAVKQAETRKRRVESLGSRLKAGKRRPCCFDRSQCTLTEA